MATCAVIPCYNVGTLCGPVVQETAQYVDHVLVVDDGSTDDTAAVVRETPARVITHARNRGKGAALITAFNTIASDPAYADVDMVVTLDGDGQHQPRELFKLREYFRGEEKCIVIGSRNVLRSDIKFRRRFGNWISTYFISIACRQPISDTQSGFRLFTRETMLAVMPYLRPGRYETETAFLIAASRIGYRVVGAPISTIYNPAAEHASHFGPLRDTARIAKVMLYYLLIKPYRKWHEDRTW